MACSGGNASPSGGDPIPMEQAHIVTQAGGLDVSATITAATLGDECGASSDTSATGSAGLCAMVDAGPDGSAKGTPPSCGGEPTCRPSNMQIAFSTGTSGQPAHADIVSVTLRDDASGSDLQTLTATAPLAWNGTTYSSWDGTLKPAGDLKVTYTLSSPTWSKMSSSTTYGSKYRLIVILRIDGTDMALESALLNREPVVST